MGTKKKQGARSGRARQAKRKAQPLAKQSATLREAERLVERWAADGITRAKIGGFDLDGVLRGKYVALDKLRSALKDGFGFCDVIFGWDVADVLYDNARITGWHTGYPDAHAVLDVSTARPVPWEPGVIALIADFRDENGAPHPACPRSLLKRVVARAEGLGYTPKLSAEFEFFFFRETPQSLQQKRFRDLEPIDPGMFGYSWVRTGQDADLMRDIMDGLRDFDIELEGLHTETGPGVYEAALRYDDALRAADKAALFKTTLKQIAHRHGLVVTFMAKCSADLPGCSGHVHQSLWKKGKNAFYDERTGSMSQLMRHYLGGQVALMRELTAMVSPTINSYKRYVPGVWAPIVASWGVENRTCSIRVIGEDDPKAIRIEHRQPAADMNPYVAMAASLGAGLWGIEHELEPPEPVAGDPGTEGPNKLPTTLHRAIDLMRESRAAKQLFGEQFVDHYLRTRDWEARCYDIAVTDWELARYFEII